MLVIMRSCLQYMSFVYWLYMHIIREYTHADIAAVKQCIEELQEYERLMDPHRIEGVKIAHDYLEHLLKVCEQGVGKIFVVEINNEVVGMISVYIEDDKKHCRTSHRFAYISDLIVMKEHKNDGVVKELIETAETYARTQNVSSIQASILKNHEESLQGYFRNGFQEWEIRVRKIIE